MTTEAITYTRDDVIEWQRNLTAYALKQLSIDYQNGSNDPADRDGWLEYLRRVSRGLMLPAKIPTRCENHRTPSRKINYACNECMKIRQMIHGSDQGSPKSAA